MRSKAAADPIFTEADVRAYADLYLGAADRAHPLASPVFADLTGRCQPLDGGHGLPGIPAQRKARREYENRVSTLNPTGP